MSIPIPATKLLPLKSASHHVLANFIDQNAYF